MRGFLKVFLIGFLLSVSLYSIASTLEASNTSVVERFQNTFQMIQSSLTVTV